MRYIKSKDGVKIAVYDYNQNSKRTVFLIHGWPLSHKIFEYQIELLTNNGYRAVAVDLRGFGASDTPAQGYSYDIMASDIHAVVSELQLRDFILTGFSMGGAIALRYLRLFRGMGVSKLILLAAAAPRYTQTKDFPYGVSIDSVNQQIRLASTDRPQLCENFSKNLFNKPHSAPAIRWFESIALSASGIGTIRTAMSLRDEDGRNDLSYVKAPTTIFYGTKDQVVPGDLITLQNRHIHNSKLVTLENCGHGIMYDDLEEFNKYFLQAVK